MAALTVYARTANPTFVAASASDTFVNNGSTELLVINNSTGALDVTISAVGLCRHGFLDDQVVSCPGQSLTSIGPFEAQRFNDSQGRATVTYEDEASIEVAARRQN